MCSDFLDTIIYPFRKSEIGQDSNVDNIEISSDFIFI